MTGRGAGYCAGYSFPGYMNPVGGYGRGWRGGHGKGLGRGWGRGRYYYPPPALQPVFPPAHQPITTTPEQEILALENYQKELESEKADLNQEMEGVEARIKELYFISK